MTKEKFLNKLSELMVEAGANVYMTKKFIMIVGPEDNWVVREAELDKAMDEARKEKEFREKVKEESERYLARSSDWFDIF